MENKFFEGFENIEIPYKEYINSNNKKTILFLHGIFENIDLYEDFADFFYKAGYNVFLLEIRDHGILQNGIVTDFGSGRIESVIKDINLFIKNKLNHINYKDIILFGHGLGALICSYLCITNPFKNLIISSMLLEKKLILEANILRTNLEMKLNLEQSYLNNYYTYADKHYKSEGKTAYITSDKNMQKRIKNSYTFNRIASPAFFNDVFRLMKFVKKNLKLIDFEINMLSIYGGNDKLMQEDRIKKYTTFINNKTRKIKIIKNNQGRFNNLLEKNRLALYEEIDKWLKKLN